MDRVPPLPAARMLHEELLLLRPHAPVSAPLPDSATAPDLATLFARAHAAGLSALCLSGGGVRSASFAIGLLEGLARHARLDTFDYISSVSGGGYAAAWLGAWRHHASRADGPFVPPPQPWPDTPLQPGGPAEPEPLLRLRRYVRYLAPHAGFFSLDLWAMLATMGRNLLLIWLVLLPLLGAVLLVPYIYYAAIRMLDRDLVAQSGFSAGEPGTWFLAGSVGLVVLAVTYIGRNLPSLGGRAGTQRQFLAWCLVPLCAGALGLTMFWAFDLVPVRAHVTIPGTAALTLLIWLVAGFMTGRTWRPKTWLAGVVAGGVTGAGLWLLTTGPFADGHALRYGYATFAFPLLLALTMLGTVLQVGLSRNETSAADLEWWSRFHGWLMVVAITWLGAALVVFWGPIAISYLARQVLGIAGLGSARISAIIGMLATAAGGLTAVSGRAVAADPDRKRLLPRIAAALAAPSFVLLVLTFLALLNLKALRSISSGALELDRPLEALMGQLHFAESIGLALALLAFSAVMTLLLPVNKYSLHGMYRNRLVRTFVGAARPLAERTASPFTNFDEGDDVALAELAPLGRPFHVVNATLNMVADTRLSAQQRKSESFTFSALHSGAWPLGYRPTREYASDGKGARGVTLGEAITLSGAAASPNMGARSSPALTFLMTLLNARLGAWLGNPGLAGQATWRDADPRLGPWLLVRELMGATTEESPYVFLSDGGHFENLGMYEMVRRRCHLIVVSDAGCDPDYAFDDLSNAIRKIRIDFSIPISFADGVPIGRQGAAHFAVGRILYSAVDGPDAPDGVLVYAKATMTGDEPRDVVNYAQSHPAFPHESTANQFFSEAQFESYRVLGRHTVEQLFAGESPLPAGVYDVPARGAVHV